MNDDAGEYMYSIESVDIGNEIKLSGADYRVVSCLPYKSGGYLIGLTVERIHATDIYGNRI